MVGVTMRGSKKADRDFEKRLEVAPVVENGELTRGVSTWSGRKEIRVPDRRLDAVLVAEDGGLACVGGLVDGDGPVDGGELADDSELVDGLEFVFRDSIGDFNWRHAYRRDTTFRTIYGKVEMAGNRWMGSSSMRMGLCYMTR